MSSPEHTASARAAIETVWRIEAPRLIGGLLRWTRNLDRAEDLAQEALLIACEEWPKTGVPRNPGAWLMTTARHKAIDRARQHALRTTKLEEFQQSAETTFVLDEDATLSVPDDVLRLILVTCHPILSKDSRVALTLRLVAGLSTAEISRALLAQESAVAQRISRAKRTIAEAGVSFEVPVGEDLRKRIPSVLEVIYLIFNEGYSASVGDAWIRPELCQEALRLGRILLGWRQDDSEVFGLLALMELQSSRFRARLNAAGEPVLLLDQDRRLWDRLAITRGLAILERAQNLSRPLGPYGLQAAIAACHARAPTGVDTNWEAIVALYDALFELTGSPVVELNRAVAVSMAYGPQPALELVDALLGDPALSGYYLLPVVRAEFLAKLGRFREARVELERAAQLAPHAKEKARLLAQAASFVEPAKDGGS